MTPDIKTRNSHRVLWAPAPHPPPSEDPSPSDAEALRRSVSPPREPILPFPSRREVGFFGTYGPLFYFVLLASIPVLGVLLLMLSSGPDPTFAPLSDDERTALARIAPPSSIAPITLHVESYPDEALVYVDGAFEGVTSLQSSGLAPGWHTVTLRKNGFALIDSLVYFASGETTALSFALDSTALATRDAAPTDAPTAADTEADRDAELPVEPQRGAVRIEVSPTGATVHLDGARMGRSPLRLRDLRSGTHEVTLSLPGYASQTRRILVAPGTQATLRADLAPLTGTLSVAVSPWGSIYIDDVLHARDTDLRHDIIVPIGTHVVRAVHPVLGTQEWRVDVKADQATPVDFDLN